MEVDTADSAAAGLQQVISTLRRQLDVTRKQVLSCQQLKDKKEALLQTGYNVLQDHCAAASLGPNACDFHQNNFQAAVTDSAPCSSGWNVSIQVQVPSELLETVHVTITATLPGIGIDGCVVKQLEEVHVKPTEATAGMAAEAGVVQASALIDLQGFPVNNATLDIYALVTSSSQNNGILSAAVHAGHVILDRAAWLLSFCHRSPEKMEEKGNGAGQQKTVWPYAAHFSVEMPQNIETIDRNWLDMFLVEQLGCSRCSTSVGAATERWCLGSAAQVHSTHLDGSKSTIPISIYGESMQIVWTIQEELKRKLEKKVQEDGDGSDEGALPKWIQKRYSFTDKTKKDRDNNTLKSSIDALISELDTHTTWTEALKKQQAAGNSMLARQQVLVAQAAAVDAMIHTDATATAVARTHGLEDC